MTHDIILSHDALLGRCRTCKHEGRNRGVPESLCDVKGWEGQPGLSCRYHEPVMGYTYGI